MQVTGTITKVLPLKTGITTNGGTWAAQQYVIESDAPDKASVLLEVFGQKNIDDFGIAMGEALTVTFIPKVRDFNGRVFGKNCVTSVDRTGQTVTE